MSNILDTLLSSDINIECDLSIGRGEKGDRGHDGASIQYMWDGTKLGVKKEDEESYSFCDLKGEDGNVSFEELTQEQIDTLRGEKGDKGDKGDKGETPSISHLENSVDSKISEINAVLEVVQEEEEKRISSENDRIENMESNQTKFNRYEQTFNDKILEVNDVKNSVITIKNETEIVKSQAEDKIVDCENRMDFIENEFDSLVGGTGFATKTYVDKEVSNSLISSNSYTDDKISKIKNLEIVQVLELPTIGEVGKVYLLNDESSKDNLYTEYIWVNEKWEIWGSASIDLTPYATFEYVDVELNKKSDTSHRHDSIYASKSSEHIHVNLDALNKINNEKINEWNNKVDKETGKGLSTNDFTNEHKDKLINLEILPHPDSHPASIIVQDSNNRFVTDVEKSTWNNKVDKETGKGLSTNDFTNGEKNKLAGISNNANNYVHPNDSNTRHVTDVEKSTWNNKVDINDKETSESLTWSSSKIKYELDRQNANNIVFKSMTVSESNWSATPDGYYNVTVNHGLNTGNIFPYITKTDTKESVFAHTQIINGNELYIKSKTPFDLTILFMYEASQSQGLKSNVYEDVMRRISLLEDENRFLKNKLSLIVDKL